MCVRMWLHHPHSLSVCLSAYPSACLSPVPPHSLSFRCSDDGDNADVEGGDEGERDDEGGMPSRLFDIRQSSHKKVSTFLVE